jgi:hypothetical protein
MSGHAQVSSQHDVTGTSTNNMKNPAIITLLMCLYDYLIDVGAHITHTLSLYSEFIDWNLKTRNKHMKYKGFRSILRKPLDDDRKLNPR